ncbi:hypothetical protein [Cloacibacillus evryensis]|uniref:hypothetical protein n=1 Tax=Cloacibacillus evryensis TaxID=508460 RepID=UPI00210EEF1A|nr:hypothetical protein [Cloacibacillus evryensis]MCQ4763205.1 hypothetical protein [Cloacibacillus evryensis]
MIDFFSMIFKYFNAWLLMGFALVTAIATEKFYLLSISIMLRKRRLEDGAPAVRGVRAIFRLEIGLPESASVNIALYAPALAVASLMTVCASLPYCTFIPIIDNGSDIIQLVQFMLLSEIFALISLYALGSGTGNEIARSEMRGMLRLLVPLMACCASLASFFTKNGLDSDPFSLNSFSMTGHFASMSQWGICGVILFVFVILSQIPHRSISAGSALFMHGESPEYAGAPRGMLQIWSVFRAFIVISLVTYILFPSDMIATISEGLGISWRGQALNFIIFWLAVAAARLILVPACWITVQCAENRLPKPIRGSLIPILTVAAMLLLWYEGILLSQEAASF